MEAADDSRIEGSITINMEDIFLLETLPYGIPMAAATSEGSEEIVATGEAPPKKKRGRRLIAEAASSSNSTGSVRPRKRKNCQTTKPLDEEGKKRQNAIKSRLYRALLKQRDTALQKELQEVTRERDNLRFRVDELNRKVSEMKENKKIFLNKAHSLFLYLNI
ncbi:uncharacterized protein [Palaemon carinicauda]|uniref:uncharacterized protein isoform X2 n=1 Tax=Palaemon carinicauda TaxID=392227 RepID=UPI0035B62EEC